MSDDGRRNKKPDAIPGGGGGPNSLHRLYSEQQAERQAKRNGRAIGDEVEDGQSGTSIFDPVLCELAYRWFCPPAGRVLDPFAGGSVRGIVASRLGRDYVGVDLSERQLEANRAQAKAICSEHAPEWIVGDSRFTKPAGPFDFVFSCPPYGDLEVYSDDPRDLSTMAWPDFVTAFREIVALACEPLKPDRFACFVVGDLRDGAGYYRNFPGVTAAAFEAAGLRLYNEAILVTALGSLAIRAARPFEASRKLGKTHQNVLVFCKGNPARAADAIGEVEFGALDEIGGEQPAPGGEIGGEIGGEVA